MRYIRDVRHYRGRRRHLFRHQRLVLAVSILIVLGGVATVIALYKNGNGGGSPTPVATDAPPSTPTTDAPSPPSIKVVSRNYSRRYVPLAASVAAVSGIIIFVSLSIVPNLGVLRAADVYMPILGLLAFSSFILFVVALVLGWTEEYLPVYLEGDTTTSVYMLGDISGVICCFFTSMLVVGFVVMVGSSRPGGNNNIDDEEGIMGLENFQLDGQAASSENKVNDWREEALQEGVGNTPPEG